MRKQAQAPPPGEPMEAVRVVSITDGFNAEAIAAAAGIEGVINAQPVTRRRLHGRLMERLAGARVRATVVAWDFHFQTRGPDEEFVAGVRALREAGVDTLVAAEWALGPDEPVHIGPAIRDAGVRWGGFTFPADERVPWKLDTVAQRGRHVPKPSLALEAFAASLHPGHRADYILHQIAGTVEIRFQPSETGGRINNLNISGQSWKY